MDKEMKLLRWGAPKIESGITITVLASVILGVVFVLFNAFQKLNSIQWP